MYTNHVLGNTLEKVAGKSIRNLFFTFSSKPDCQVMENETVYLDGKMENFHCIHKEDSFIPSIRTFIKKKFIFQATV